MFCKKTFHRILKILLGSVIVLYIVCVLALPYIEIPAQTTAEPKNIEIYLLTNGVHTDLALPVTTAEMDWRNEIPFEHTRAQRSDYRYIAFGWGDKGFYLETPTWADLKASTALKAAFGIDNSAMHSTFYHQLSEGKDSRRIMVSHQEYLALVRYIQRRFTRDSDGKPRWIPTDAVYGEDDAFYEAKGRYNLFFTCNTWTNDGLKTAGQKAAFWTVTDKGIFEHYPDKSD